MNSSVRFLMLAATGLVALTACPTPPGRLTHDWLLESLEHRLHERECHFAARRDGRANDGGTF